MQEKNNINNITWLHQAMITLGFCDKENGKLDISGFSKNTGIEYQTLMTWKRNSKVSALGEVVLKSIIEKKNLEDELNDYRELKRLIEKMSNPKTKDEINSN